MISLAELEAGVWTQANGKRILVERMTKDHIHNSIAMLERNLASLPYPMFQGEMAQMYAEQDYDQQTEFFSQWIETLRKELTRRDIKDGTIPAL